MRLAARAARVLGIRQGEERVVARVVVLMLVAWSGFAIGANGVESLFFTRFGPRFLPWMFIAVGIVTVPVTMIVSGLLSRFDRRRVLVAAPLAMAGVVVVLRFLPMLRASWVYPVLWLSMMVLWVVQAVTSWGVAGEVHDARQAKRLFALYGSAVILGGAIGGLTTAPLVAVVGAENLLLPWAGSLVATAALSAGVVGVGRRRRHPWLRGRRRKPAPFHTQLSEGLRATKSSRFLRRLSVATMLFGLLYFTLSLPFAQAVTARYPDADRLAGFLGLFAGASNAVALVVSLVVATRLYARVGVPATIVAMALVYVVGFGALAIGASFALLVAFRFVQLVWFHGVYVTGRHALFNVVPAQRREQARTFVEGVPQQLGVIAAGVLLLLAQRVLDPPLLFALAAGVGVLSAAAAWSLRRAYGAAVVESLREGLPDVFAGDASFAAVRWDAAAFEALRAGTADGDPAVRRIAMEVAADVPLLLARDLCRAGLRDEDPAVRAAALRGVARSGSPAAVEEIVRLLRDPEAPVRLAAIDAFSGSGDPPAAAPSLAPLLDDPDVRVRLRAGRVLARSTPAARELLVRAADGSDAVARALAVEALGACGIERSVVERALADEDPAVRAAAAAALGRWGLDAVAVLLGALADVDVRVREAAADALGSLGEPVVPELLAALEDPRREDGALTALGRCSGVDPEPMQRYARRQVAEALRYHRLWCGVGRDGDGRTALLSHALRWRALDHADRALRATVPHGDHAAIRLATEGLASREATQRANAVETLEATGDRRVIGPLLGVWDGLESSRPDPPAAVAAAMDDDDPWVRASAVFAATGDGAVRPQVERVSETDPDPLVRETARAAVRGETGMETRATLSVMERVLALREVPLFRELSPSDLRHVAEVVSEQLFPDGTLLAERGDPGDTMYVIVSGDVRVLVEEDDRLVEVARRGRGYIVGEMAVLSDEPRMASLVADGDVRALALDRIRFQRILRERPDAALAVMRELSARLREAHRHAKVEVPR